MQIAVSDNQTVNLFIANAEIRSKNTAESYQKKLTVFGEYVLKNYNVSIDALIQSLNESKMDVYKILSGFVSYLIKVRKVKALSIKQYVSTVRVFLETFDVEISPRKFKLKVLMPRPVKSEKSALDKNNVQEILNGCHNIRLKTYVLTIAATGMRAQEALSIRLCDINFESDSATIFIRGEFTKTKTDRIVPLTSELVSYLKQWIDYKHRTRIVTRYNNGVKVNVEKRTPKVDNEQLLFALREIEDENNRDGLYNNFLVMFEQVLDRLGGKYAQFESSGNRRKITLHSFRRFVKTTISNLGYSEYSEYFIGHKHSTYYDVPQREKVALFKKIEPYLTYLDQTALEVKSKVQESRIEALEQENQELKTDVSQIQEALSEWRKVKERLGLT